MTRHLTLTTGIVFSALALLYLGVSAYHARAPRKVDTLENLHAQVQVLGQIGVPVSMIVFTDYRCPHRRAFERAVMPKLDQLGETRRGLDERTHN